MAAPIAGAIVLAVVPWRGRVYRDSHPAFVITDRDHAELLAVDTTAGAPDDVIVDREHELVRFLDPDSDAELVVLSFRELADSWAQIAGPPQLA